MPVVQTTGEPGTVEWKMFFGDEVFIDTPRPQRCSLHAHAPACTRMRSETRKRSEHHFVYLPSLRHPLSTLA